MDAIIYDKIDEVQGKVEYNGGHKFPSTGHGGIACQGRS